ncbi:glucosidase 2 subunit beta-like, partial [Saccoglossus kowalevskii]
KRLDELREEKRQVDAIREEKRAAKEVAEAPEKEAKDKHKESWEKIKEQIKEEKQREEASFAFNELDINDDKLVSTDELQSHLEFDADNNGEVSHEEAV